MCVCLPVIGGSKPPALLRLCVSSCTFAYAGSERRRSQQHPSKASSACFHVSLLHGAVRSLSLSLSGKINKEGGIMSGISKSCARVACIAHPCPKVLPAPRWPQILCLLNPIAPQESQVVQRALGLFVRRSLAIKWDNISMA
jgi:hypothetical protein